MREGLLETAQKTHTRYRPEDVWLRLRCDPPSAHAFAIEIDQERRGFAILTMEFDPDGPVLFVWALWGLKLAQHKSCIYSELERIAREVKAVRIRMQSPRKGWERESFFSPVSTLFEHEVTKC